MEKNLTHHCKMCNCAYYKFGGCKPCGVCGTESYIINDKCTKCFACENKENSIRWGDRHKEEIIMLTELVKMIKARAEEIEKEQAEEESMELIVKNGKENR